jgi:Flp pilus assembly protein TadG
VELAIVLPVLVTLVLAAVDFGRFAASYIAVINAARAGAGYAIMNGSTANTAAWQNAILATAQNEIAGQIGNAGAANLTVSPLPTATQDGRVAVTVNYPFTTLVNWQWTGLGIPSTITLFSTIEMRMIQ